MDAFSVYDHSLHLVYNVMEHILLVMASNKNIIIIIIIIIIMIIYNGMAPKNFKNYHLLDNMPYNN